MNRSEITVFVRIFLYALAGRLAAGDSLFADVAEQMQIDPQAMDLLAAAVVGGGALAWYWVSAARKALKERLG